MYNDQLVYKVVIWAFLGISLLKDKEALSPSGLRMTVPVLMCITTTTISSVVW